jgi:hypothetical protein
MKTLALLLILVVACRHAPKPSTDQKENAELAKSLCPGDDHPLLAIGHVEIACCVGGVDVWYPRGCVDRRPSDYARDNFCGQTPIGGHLYIKRTGEWWCCNGGQCGN